MNPEAAHAFGCAECPEEFEKAELQPRMTAALAKGH
jgi:hypothetical protein